MKAIETRYKGWRFRSRLEARWAVYFDSLGLEWEYEKEGYDLGDGISYLPDFWLPGMDAWAEVKPMEFTEIERAKAERLCSESLKDVHLLVGVPDDKEYEYLNAYVFHDDEEFHRITDDLDNRQDWVKNSAGTLMYMYTGRLRYMNEYGVRTSNTLIAVNAARSARFEFDERDPAIELERARAAFNVEAGKTRNR